MATPNYLGIADELASYEESRLIRSVSVRMAVLEAVRALRFAADQAKREPLVSNPTLIPPRGVSEFTCEFCGEDYPWHHKKCGYVTELARLRAQGART